MSTVNDGSRFTFTWLQPRQPLPRGNADLRDLSALLAQLQDRAPLITELDLDLVLQRGTTILVVRDTTADDKIVGMATLLLTHQLTGRRARLVDAIVDPSLQKQRIGRSALQAIRARAIHHEMTRLVIDGEAAYRAHGPTLKKLGFKAQKDGTYVIQLSPNPSP